MKKLGAIAVLIFLFVCAYIFTHSPAPATVTTQATTLPAANPAQAAKC
jgi:hypothetical protein